jgi:hypothetical protein
MTVSSRTKVALLAAVTALAVAYLRQILQYRSYSWVSVGEFASIWFIHYIAVGLLAIIAYACIKTWEKFFLGENPEYHRLDIDEALFYIFATLLVTAVAVFLIAHWPSSPEE